MATLPKDWLTDGLIDTEYKRYILLAYLQHVDKEFADRKLYPTLAELIEHYRQLQLVREQKKVMTNSFPKEISRMDLKELKFEYRDLVMDDATMRDLEEIIDFAIPEIRSKVSAGQEIYEEVEDKISIIPIGIQPLQHDEGYLMLSDYLQRIINVYYYNITIFENAMSRLRGIHTRLIDQYEMTVTNTYEDIKYRLTQQMPEIPAPATYALEFRESFPLAETMLPIAKRVFVKYVTTA